MLAQMGWRTSRTGTAVDVSRRALAVAAGCTALALVAFLVLPLIGESESGAHFPSVGAAAWWSGMIVLLAQGATLTQRYARPLGALTAVAAAVPVGAALGMADLIGVTSLAVIVAVYAVGCLETPARARLALVAAGVLVAAGQAVVRARMHDGVGAVLGNSVLQAAGAVVLPLLLALFVSARRDARSSREHEVLAAGREREAHLQAAVSRERLAMARELHDIAAHHLSGIAVMTAAIGTQIDTDPVAAKVAVAQVREQSRTLLRDLRGLVGLLRDERPAEHRRSPSTQQTLAGIADLVDEANAAGALVQLTVLRNRAGVSLGDGIGPLAQLAAYRIVQESLANAARHAAGAPARVVVDDRGAGTLSVTVDNDAVRPAVTPDASGGFGLVGMRERADLTGAQLTYGPTPDGGWQVSVTMPRLSDTVAEPA